MIERTLVLLKPDAVERGLIGEIIHRFERVGLKIVGLKLVQPNKETALLHYTEDITVRRGQKVRDMLVEFLATGTIVAMVLEGVAAVENVRRLVGSTQPKEAAPGTIRGDYSHVSYAYADAKNMVIKNLIHASANVEEAKTEVAVWFKENELLNYSVVHEKHTR